MSGVPGWGRRVRALRESAVRPAARAAAIDAALALAGFVACARGMPGGTLYGATAAALWLNLAWRLRPGAL